MQANMMDSIAPAKQEVAESLRSTGPGVGGRRYQSAIPAPRRTSCDRVGDRALDV